MVDRAELARRGIVMQLCVHPIVLVRREGGTLVEVGIEAGTGVPESMMHIEIAASADAAGREGLRAGIAEVLAGLRGLPLADLAAATTRNACQALPRLEALLAGAAP